jgi:hypothetical protein
MNSQKNILNISPLLYNPGNVDVAKLEREIMEDNTITDISNIDVVKEFNAELEKITQGFKEIKENTDASALASKEEYKILKDGKDGKNGKDDKFSKNGSDRNGKEEKTKTEDESKENKDFRDYKNNREIITMEETNQKHIQNVFDSIRASSNSDATDLEKNIANELTRESIEEDKMELLNEIDSLKESLEDEGCNVRYIPNVDKHSSYEEIKSVHKRLRDKIDRQQYSAIAHEGIMAIFYGLEYLFDGEKEWFGRRPDLTGFTKQVSAKLARRKWETSCMVKNILQKYDISPTTKLFLELVPSMLLYSREQKSHPNNNGKTPINDKNVDAAISKMNNLDNS